MPAMSNSQGTKEAFSTGSQAQNPPKLSDSYAHFPPIMIPVPNIAAVPNAHGKATETHSPNFFC